MTYSTAITVDFPVSPSVVFDAIIDLDRAMIWNSGMKTVSHTGMMKVGMHYHTTSVVIGKVNHADVTVVKVERPRTIILRSDTGEITFLGTYTFKPKGDDGCSLTCSLEFELIGLMLNMAHNVIESMARARITGDLQTLRAMLAPTHP